MTIAPPQFFPWTVLRSNSIEMSLLDTLESSSSASSSDLGDVRDIDAEESVLQDDIELNRGALDR